MIFTKRNTKAKNIFTKWSFPDKLQTLPEALDLCKAQSHRKKTKKKPDKIYLNCR